MLGQRDKMTNKEELDCAGLTLSEMAINFDFSIF